VNHSVYGDEDLYQAAREIAIKGNKSVENASKERSRVTQVSYVLVNDNGSLIQRIPIGDVISRAETNQARNAPPVRHVEPQPVKTYLTKHEQEQYEGAVFFAEINGLIRSESTPSKLHSHSAPGFSGNFLLKDEQGNLISQVSAFSIANANLLKKRRAKIRASIEAGVQEKTATMLIRTLGGKITFHSGFWTGSALATEWNTLIHMSPPFEEIDMRHIAEIRVMDTLNEKDMAGAIATSAMAGAALGLLTGGLGLIAAGAGLIAGGNTSTKLLQILLVDGRQALLSAPAKTYSKILALTHFSPKESISTQLVEKPVLPPSPSPPPRPQGWGTVGDSQDSKQNKQTLNPGQIQFLKKIRDGSFTREFLNYLKNIEYYRDLVGGDVEAFVEQLVIWGYVHRDENQPESWSCTDLGKDITQIVRPEDCEDLILLTARLKDLDASEVLKIATEYKREKDYDCSAKVLLVAYEKISLGSTVYGVETFLRLPKYLHAAGRHDEAWACLNKLHAGGYPNQPADIDLKELDSSKIYACMSRLMRKEGNSRKAVIYEAMSLLAFAIYNYIQASDKNLPAEIRKERRLSFAEISDGGFIEECLRKAAGKAGSRMGLSEVASCLVRVLENPLWVTHEKVFVDLDDILQ
jgi:hypothetical protein